VSANVESFALSAQGKQSYLFTDSEKIDNVALLEAIKISSALEKPVRPETLSSNV